MTTPLPEPVSGRCKACNQTGLSHCSDPINCGGMEFHYTEAQMHEHGAAEYRRGTEELESHGRVLRKTMEALQAVTAKRDDLTKLLHQALDERDHYVKERDGLTVRLQEVVNTFANEIDTFRAERDALRTALKEATKWAGKGSQVEVIAREALKGTS